MRNSETSLVRSCLELLAAYGVVAWRQNQGGLHAEYRGRKRFVRFSSASGVSDILGIIPPAGRFLAVECKKRPNKPTPDQLAFLENVRKAGGVGIVVYDLGQMETAIKEFLR